MFKNLGARKFISGIFGVVLLIAGCAIFLYPNYRDWQIRGQSNDILEQIQNDKNQAESLGLDDANVETVPATGSSDSTEDASSNNSGINSDSKVDVEYLYQTIRPELRQALIEYNDNLIQHGQYIQDAWSYEAPPIDLDINDGDASIGTITIPDMRVTDMPLFMGASPRNLANGAAVMSQTSMPIGGANTNTVVAAHRGFRGSSYFQFIENMQLGSLVYVTNPWETLVYQMVDYTIVGPDDSSAVMIQNGKDMLTLVTCHPYVIGGGPERYIVYCERVDDIDGAEIPEISIEKHEEPKPGRLDPATGKVDPESYKPIAHIISGQDNLLMVEQYVRFLIPLAFLMLVGIIWLVRLIRRYGSRNDNFR